MTVEELLNKINRAISAGKILPSDPVFVRNSSVSEAAVSAGSNPFIEAEEILVILDANAAGLTAGIYLDFEFYD
jgi:hypothetical protein